MARQIRITIAEASEVIRRGLSVVLKADPTLHVVVSELEEAGQLRKDLAWQKPDVLIVNPSLTGLVSLPQIRKENGNPEMKCVALQTSLADAATARNYDETISLYDSAESIREKILRLIHAPEPEKRHEALSRREKEIIVCVIKGLTNKQIADQLCLSSHTVNTHRRNISAKLDIHSVSGLTIYAIVNKLIDLEELNAGEAG